MLIPRIVVVGFLFIVISLSSYRNSPALTINHGQWSYTIYDCIKRSILGILNTLAWRRNMDIEHNKISLILFIKPRVHLFFFCHRNRSPSKWDIRSVNKTNVKHFSSKYIKKEISKLYLAKSRWSYPDSWADACRNCQSVWFPAPVVFKLFDYEPLARLARYLILLGFMFGTLNSWVRSLTRYKWPRQY